ncbi:MAG: DUF4250 domain-containing protein [Thiohalobacteraceae bacterium]
MNRIDVDRMDVHLLYSLINTKLRNEYADLEDLARGLDIDRAALETRLGEAGYAYYAEARQFRRVD